MTTRRVDDPASSAKSGVARPALAPVLDFVEAIDASWQLTHPARLGTREEVAAHETGHAIAFEAEQWGLIRAEIRPTFVEEQGLRWTGIAQPRMRLAGFSIIMPDFILTEAVMLLAGAAAVWMFTGQDPFTSSFEILNAVSLAAEYSNKEGVEVSQALFGLFSRTACILHHNRDSYLWLADRLARRKSVSRRERRVAEVLDRVKAVPAFALPPAPDQERALARHFAGAPIDLDTFAREIVRLTREAGR